MSTRVGVEVTCQNCGIPFHQSEKRILNFCLERSKRFQKDYPIGSRNEVNPITESFRVKDWNEYEMEMGWYDPHKYKICGGAFDIDVGYVYSNEYGYNPIFWLRMYFRGSEAILFTDLLKAGHAIQLSSTKLNIQRERRIVKENPTRLDILLEEREAKRHWKRLRKIA